MQLWSSLAEVPAELTTPGGAGTVVSVGIFDGVHRGHQAILARMREAADTLAMAPGSRGRPLTVAMTFAPHPAQIHRPEQAPALISTVEERLALLEDAGLDAVLLVPYTLEFAAQSPQDFVRTWFEQGLGARAIVVGDDVRFGHGNEGDAKTLAAICESDGMTLEIVHDVLSPQGRRWSSSWVRELVEAGEVEQAAEVLGHPFRLRGTVQHGFKRGREFGFPTANLAATPHAVLPPDGVYAGWLTILGARGEPEELARGALGEGDAPRGRSEQRAARMAAAISLGTNPTFDDVPERTIEAHVLGRADLDLYDRTVLVEFTHHLRPMVAFEGFEALRSQMCADVSEAAQLLGVPEPAPIDPHDVTA